MAKLKNLATLEEFNDYLIGVGSNGANSFRNNQPKQEDEDKLKQIILGAVSSYIRAYTNNDITLTKYTEIGKLDGQQFYSTSARNIKQILSISVDGTDLNSDKYKSYVDSIYFPNSNYNPYQNIEINYIAGEEEIPEDIKFACIQIAAIRYNERSRIGIISQNNSGSSVSYDVSKFPAWILECLNTYRIWSNDSICVVSRQDA